MVGGICLRVFVDLFRPIGCSVRVVKLSLCWSNFDWFCLSWSLTLLRVFNFKYIGSILVGLRKSWGLFFVRACNIFYFGFDINRVGGHVSEVISPVILGFNHLYTLHCSNKQQCKTTQRLWWKKDRRRKYFVTPKNCTDFQKTKDYK